MLLLLLLSCCGVVHGNSLERSNSHSTKRSLRSSNHSAMPVGLCHQGLPSSPSNQARFGSVQGLSVCLTIHLSSRIAHSILCSGFPSSFMLTAHAAVLGPCRTRCHICHFEGSSAWAAARGVPGRDGILRWIRPICLLPAAVPMSLLLSC